METITKQQFINALEVEPPRMLAAILANYIGSDDYHLWLKEVTSNQGPFSKGTLFVTKRGKRGILTGTYEPCHRQGCAGTCFDIRWPDGTVTNMCTATAQWRDDYWEIK